MKIKPSAICYLLLVMAAVALAAPKARQEARPSPRLDITLHASNSADPEKLFADLDKALKKATPKQDKRNRDLATTINGFKDFTLTATLFLSDTNQADSVFAEIRAMAKPANVSGTVVIHHCPEDSDMDYRDWAGCRDDARASYREERF